jgi:hypothetical protein
MRAARGAQSAAAKKPTDASKKDGKDGKGGKDKEQSPGEARVERRLTYLAINWAIQISCGLFCFSLVLWATVQSMRVWNILGIGAIPPGLEHAPTDT